MVGKKAQMGDFIGFSFNGIHSSELGLVRVSDGNRYEKSLFPAISDKTVQVPGRDGFYYFGSSYNSREITIKVAFDNLEENEFRRMTELFKDKKLHFLWFDELPYKEYLVKVKSPPNFKYLCFDEWVEEENDGEITKRKARIYKGEGTIIFVCYSPYARARAKSLNETIDKVITRNSGKWPDWFDNYYLNGENDKGDSGEKRRKDFSSSYLKLINENYDSEFRTLNQFYNIDEWRDSSNIPDNLDEGNGLTLLNCGDVDMNIKILFFVKFSDTIGLEDYLTIELNKKDSRDQIIVTPNDPKIKINLYELYKLEKKYSGEVYNNSYYCYFLDSNTKLLRNYKSNMSLPDSWDTNNEGNNVYNKCIAEGDFFKIPIESDLIKSNKYIIRCPDRRFDNMSPIVKLEYTYLYY